MSEYWERRQSYGYYVLVNAWLDAISLSMARTDTSLLDVGPLDTPVSTWGYFDRRYAVDRDHLVDFPRVLAFKEDFLTWRPPERMTVVTCLQVLEHLPDGVVYDFAYKLRHVADYTVVSVPFMWKKGLEPDHKQDPIDFEKISAIMSGPPDEHAIIKDTKHLRLVGLWRNNLVP